MHNRRFPREPRLSDMLFIKANEMTLHVRDSGTRTGPALVFINSLGTDFRVWQDVPAAFASRCRVVCYDKRGHGLSTAPPAPYSMQDHVDDLDALLHALNIDQAILCGVSVGGLIAQGFCAMHPDRVSALVLCDTAAKIGSDDLWNQRIEQIERNGIEAIADAILERWFSRDFRSRRPTELEGWRNMLTRTPSAGYTGTSAAIRDTDYTESTRGIDKPTLVVCGDEDGATPPEVTRSLTELIEGARFVLVSGAGHLPSVEQPGVLIESIDAFLKEHGIA